MIRYGGVPVLLGTLLLTSAGCWFPVSPKPITVHPSAGPSNPLSPTPGPISVSPVPGSGLYSDAGIEVSGGSLTVTVTGPKGIKLKGASVRVYGTTMASTVVDANGLGTLGPLVVGTGYRVVAAAEGYASAQVDGIEIKKNADTRRTIELAPETVITGHVSAQGLPVPDAVVSDGLNSTLSDAAGSYTLRGIAGPSVTISAAKSRFSASSKAVSAADKVPTSLDFELSATQPTLYLDATAAPGIDSTKFNGLRAELVAAGWQITDQPPSAGAVWMIICPSKPFPNQQIEKITSFVAQGGKLVYLGEWGGFAQFNNPGANILAHQVGLHFNPDLVRDPSDHGPSEPIDWLNIINFPTAAAPMQGIKRLKFYDSCSLFGLDPMAIWARTSSASYRVQDNAIPSSQTVVMAGTYKGGKAIAIGDASAFSDEDTDGDGTPNIKEADNLALMTQLLNW